MAIYKSILSCSERAFTLNKKGVLWMLFSVKVSPATHSRGNVTGREQIWRRVAGPRKTRLIRRGASPA